MRYAPQVIAVVSDAVEHVVHLVEGELRFCLGPCPRGSGEDNEQNCGELHNRCIHWGLRQSADSTAPRSKPAHCGTIVPKKSRLPLLSIAFPESRAGEPKRKRYPVAVFKPFPAAPGFPA